MCTGEFKDLKNVKFNSRIKIIEGIIFTNRQVYIQLSSINSKFIRIHGIKICKSAAILLL